MADATVYGKIYVVHGNGRCYVGSTRCRNLWARLSRSKYSQRVNNSKLVDIMQNDYRGAWVLEEGEYTDRHELLQRESDWLRSFRGAINIRRVFPLKQLDRENCRYCGKAITKNNMKRHLENTCSRQNYGGSF